MSKLNTAPVAGAAQPSTSAGDPGRARLLWLGHQDYLRCLEQMRAFTAGRSRRTQDEIWLLEHNAVFTLGMGADSRHVLDPDQIPVIPTERGGQATYHGPGQVVAYVLVDLVRRGLLVRDLVRVLEEACIACLSAYGIHAERRDRAPGVYVRTGLQAGSKIAALGLKVRRGCSYHGIALNVAMDLEPYQRIHPCGVPKLAVTDMRNCLGAGPAIEEAGRSLGERIADRLDQAQRGKAEALPGTLR
ncbi:MAG: lipoyl(octanoyl) transferase LipB [Betaproteobacteria bacterium]